MSLPASEAIAAASNVYTWEPPNRVIAARYGLVAGDILRFDTNTSPAAPDVVAELLEGPWDPTLNEYPDSTYAELAEAAAAYVGAEPTEILVGCGADEVLDVIAKTYLGPGAGSWCRRRRMRCTRCWRRSAGRVPSTCRDAAPRLATPWTWPPSAIASPRPP